MDVVTIQKKKIIEHLFIRGEVAEKIWHHYCGFTGIIDQRLNLTQTIRMWREKNGNTREVNLLGDTTHCSLVSMEKKKH